MATTTNYGWTTPNDTDLVKDGAAAIRTLGSSVDTTTKNLNPQTTTGALAYRSATSNVNTALPLGTANQILRVNAGATAPEWATVSSGSLTLIETLTLSSSSVTSSTLPTSYKNLYIEMIDYTISTGTFIYVRPNNDTGSNYTVWSTRYQSSGSNFGPSGNGSADKIPLIDNNDIGVENNQNYNITVATIYRYNNTDSYKLTSVLAHYMNNAGVRGSTNLLGTWRSNSAITSLTFIPGAGTFAGTIKIFGVN